MERPGNGEGRDVRRKWLVFGFVAAVLNYAFLLLELVLFEIDPAEAVAVVLILSIVGGVAATIIVLYVY